MWIAVGITAFVILALAFLMLQKITVTLYNDDNSPFALSVKFLFIKFQKNSKAEKAVKKETGIDNFEKKQKKKKRKKKIDIAQTVDLISDLLEEVKKVVDRCVIERFSLNITCSAEDAADAAITYGATCAIVYPLTAVVDNLMTVRPQAKQVNIRCDFDGNEEISYNIMLSVMVYRLVATLFRVASKYLSNKIK